MEHSADAIQKWCVDYVAGLLKVPPSNIDPQLDFDRHGLDSAIAVAMVMDLEDFVGTGISPSVLFEYPNIVSLSNHLADKARGTVGGST